MGEVLQGQRAVELDAGEYGAQDDDLHRAMLYSKRAKCKRGRGYGFWRDMRRKSYSFFGPSDEIPDKWHYLDISRHYRRSKNI
jgi:hypothetical protein